MAGEIPMTDPEAVVNREKVTSEDYVTAKADSTRCVDERMDKEGENLGVQLPGASEHIMDLMLVSILETDGEISDAELMMMTENVYKSDVAKEFGLVAGVHTDDDHGNLDMEASKKRNHGCGYDKVRAKVIKNIFGYEVESSPGSRIEKAKELEWGVQILTGAHVTYATAAINFVEGKTLKTNSLWEGNRNPSFNHDIWVVEKLLPEMVAQLEEKGHKKAADILNDSAMEWSETIYGETLNVLSEGKLTGADIIAFE